MYDSPMLSARGAARLPGARRWTGSCALIAAVVSVALHVSVASSVFVPLLVRGAVEYVFISATARTFAQIVLATAATLAAGHALIRLVSGRHHSQPPLWSFEDVGYLRPLWMFSISALSLLNLVRPHGSFLAVLSYAIVDLRWWWSALTVVWLARTVQARTRGGWTPSFEPVRWPSGLTRRVPEVALAIIAIAWVVLGTPILRADDSTVGDEPKYLRYCENLYQGLGFEISAIRPIAALPADFRPKVWQNVALLAAILPGELRQLAADAVIYARDPSHPFNRARHREGGFLDGKAGGMYQVHGPGLSLLMFPAYLVDRSSPHLPPGSPLQWPARLPTVNALFVAIYAAWTILIFRFLLRLGASLPVAWTVGLVSTLTLPAAAFPFQYYPELPAGLFITAVLAHLLFGEPRRIGRSFAAGLLAGYLPWLHLRFAIVMVALLVGALVLWRGQSRRRVAFLAGAAIPAALSSLYAYRITGSVLPSAVWAAEGSEANFNLLGMIQNSAGYLLDRDWGLFAHSPVFLLALPGWWWLGRRQPRVALLSALIFLALLLPAAGKTLVQTTPMRLIVAVVPVFAIGLIEVLERRSRAVLIAFGLLLILSLDNALAYNLHHYRDMDTLTDWSFSGWKVNLLFPAESRRPFLISPVNGLLLVAWLAIVAALLSAPALIAWLRRGRWTLPPLSRHERSTAALALAAAVLFVALGSAVSAATSAWVQRRYMVPAGQAAEHAALALDALRECTLCLSSTSGHLSTRRTAANLDAIDPAVAARRQLAPTPDYQEWVEMPGQIRAWYTSAVGHPPADTDIGNLMYQWREDHVPASEIRRRIFAGAAKTP